MWCFFYEFFNSVEQMTYKQALRALVRIEAMQVEIMEFDRLGCMDTCTFPVIFLSSLKWIFKIKLDVYGESEEQSSVSSARKRYRQEAVLILRKSFAPGC
ncbi:hypothetical protein Tco_0939525 [Tanacetum coccineum]|uniref:Uncharacterized protein n=1 Tax=Tanacetum coccineum TaxID=301880 RepID=A0ABQ5DKD9_9ASTR